jgi:hypothetical protein
MQIRMMICAAATILAVASPALQARRGADTRNMPNGGDSGSTLVYADF